MAFFYSGFFLSYIIIKRTLLETQPIFVPKKTAAIQIPWSKLSSKIMGGKYFGTLPVSAGQIRVQLTYYPSLE